MSYEELGSDKRRSGNFLIESVLWNWTPRLKALGPHTRTHTRTHTHTHAVWICCYSTHPSQKCVTSRQELKCCSYGGGHSCRLSMLQLTERDQGGCCRASAGAVQPKGQLLRASCCTRKGSTYTVLSTGVWNHVVQGAVQSRRWLRTRLRTKCPVSRLTLPNEIYAELAWVLPACHPLTLEARPQAVFSNISIQLTTFRPTKCTILFLKYLYHNITLNIPTCFDPQEIIIRESNQSNTAQNQ
jgi:hypothetical protein